MIFIKKYQLLSNGRINFTNRINTWLYGGKYAISHPMIIGQLISIGALS